MAQLIECVNVVLNLSSNKKSSCEVGLGKLI